MTHAHCLPMTRSAQTRRAIRGLSITAWMAALAIACSTVQPATAAAPTDRIAVTELKPLLMLAVWWLIDRSLVLNEVNRYAPPEPTLDAIDQQIGELRRQLGSAHVFDAALLNVGVALEQLRDIVRGDLRIRAYLAQRFTADTPARSQAAITEWVEGLRRRAEIVDLYAPASP